MTLPKNILIVDIETTGLQGEPIDHVVEIGVAELVNLKDVVPVYHSIVAPYYPVTDDFDKSWVFQNTDLTPEAVLSGRSVTDVAKELAWVLNGKPATSYNYLFDFDAFLKKDPFNIDNVAMPCIMCEAGLSYHNVLPCSQWSGCPSAQATYSYLCHDNPAGLPGGIEKHRALDDALMEAYILREMIRRGDYDEE